MFAQESVMDVEKEREAFQKFCEENFDFERHEQTYFDEQTQCYENDIGEDTESINMAWSAWQAAKAQSVPDVQQALNDRLLVRSIKEQVESHIAEISVNDLFDKGWFAAMKCIQSNIDMLEAREQTHD